MTTKHNTQIGFDYKQERSVEVFTHSENKPVAMPFSGGMDSYVNMLKYKKEYPDTPLSYFYFDTGCADPKELETSRKVLGDKGFLEEIEDLNLFLLNRQPEDFIPFRNMFFSLYLAGLGFDDILFSFSGEDHIYPDTTPAFTDAFTETAFDHLKRTVEIHNYIRYDSRIDLVLWVSNEFGKKGYVWDRLLETHSCSSFPACRQCQICLQREIAFACADVFPYDHTINLPQARKLFVSHWTKDPCNAVINQLYWDCRTGRLNYNEHNSIGRQYLEFLNEFESGSLLSLD